MDDNLVLRALMGAAGASVLAEIDLEKKRQEVEDLRKDRDAARAEMETLRKELANAQRELSEQSMVANVETQQDAAAWQQQVDSANAEVSYLRARLDEERSVSAGLREQVDAANVTILAQKRGIQYLRLLIDKVRAIMNREYNGREFEDIADALNDFDHGTIEPTPCPECERLQAELETANEHRTDLLLFVDKVRKSFRVWGGDESFFHSVSHALDQLDAGTEPTPVAEPLDAEGGA